MNVMIEYVMEKEDEEKNGNKLKGKRETMMIMEKHRGREVNGKMMKMFDASDEVYCVQAERRRKIKLITR